MPGHLKDNCYCIHGYPTWHKLFGKQKPKPKFLTTKGSVVANVTQSSANSGSGGDSVSTGVPLSQSDGLTLSDEQCRQLIQMLQKTMSEKSSSSAVDN